MYMNDNQVLETCPLNIEVDVRLPQLAGKVTGLLRALELRSRSVVNVKVEIPMWANWSTQTTVGEVAQKGVGPSTHVFWAPAMAVDTDEDDMKRLKSFLDSTCTGS